MNSNAHPGTIKEQASWAYQHSSNTMSPLQQTEPIPNLPAPHQAIPVMAYQTVSGVSSSPSQGAWVFERRLLPQGTISKGVVIQIHRSEESFFKHGSDRAIFVGKVASISAHSREWAKVSLQNHHSSETASLLVPAQLLSWPSPFHRALWFLETLHRRPLPIHPTPTRRQVSSSMQMSLARGTFL